MANVEHLEEKKTQEVTRNITFKGKPGTLMGRRLRLNAEGLNFRMTLSDLNDIELRDFSGQIKLITSFVSLDTSVCDLQVKEFNKLAAGISADIAVIAISRDLPFAQRRFCESFGIKNIVVASDYKFSSFGLNYGLLIKEFNLLARAVLILDKANKVRYIEIVPEIAAPPDYEGARRKLEDVVKNPFLPQTEEFSSSCKPCEGGLPPLPRQKVEKLLAQARGWQLVEDKKIIKEFKFKDFAEAKYFLDLVSVVAESQGHHPVITLIYDKVKITLWTHAAGGLTENDFIMAGLIDELI